MILLCDGSARFLSQGTSNMTLVSLVSRDEGDPIGSEFKDQ
jgi:hypothetical protein